MSAWYLYFVIALVTIFIIIGVYLGMVIKHAPNQLCGDSSNITACYGSLIRPMLYIAQDPNASYVALFLNITNPTNALVRVKIWPYVNQPASLYLTWIPSAVLIPPKSTVSYPLLFAILNSPNLPIRMWVEVSGWDVGVLSTELIGDFRRMNLTINVLEPANITFMIRINETLQMRMSVPIGIASYSRSSPWWNFYLINPLQSPMVISGYEIHTYNGVLLTACKLDPPIIINATSMVQSSLPARSAASYSSLLRVHTSLSESAVPTSLLISCTLNYTFPSNVARLPYGYVLFNTSIGNVEIPLVPG